MTEPNRHDPLASPPQGDATGLAMPGGDDAAPKPPQIELPPPPSFSRQVLQLVVIPAGIAIIVAGLFLLFGLLVSKEDNLKDQLNRLRQSPGAGQLPGGFLDPRYKDRSFAAASIAQRIPTITDPDERRKLNAELIEILDKYVAGDDQLQMYLLMAIGQLGQEGGLAAIAQRLDSSDRLARAGAIHGLESWPKIDEARSVMPALIARLNDNDPAIRALAARLLGSLAPRGDATAIAALHNALDNPTTQDRDLHWNASIALARLGDERGARVVSGLLLDRQALSQLMSEDNSTQTLPRASQDRVMYATLMAATDMTDATVWDKIRAIAADDPSPSVRNAAKKLILKYDQAPPDR